MKILYLVSRHAEEMQFETIIKKNLVTEVYLFPLEYGCDARVCHIIQHGKDKGIKVVTIQSLQLLDQNSFRFKDQYIKWIYEISESNVGSSKNLKEFFKFDGGSASIWWLSLINERNPYKSDSFIEFVKVATMTELVESYRIDSLWFDRPLIKFYKIFQESSLKVSVNLIASKPVSIGYVLRHDGFFVFIQEQLRCLWALFQMIKRIFQARIYLRGLQQRLNHLGKVDVLAFTMFPLVDHERLKENKFVNRAYGLIDKTFKNVTKIKVAWIAMFTKIEHYNWKQSLKLGDHLNQHGEEILFYEEFIGFKTFTKIVINSLITTVKTIFHIKEFSNLFVYKFNTASIPLWRLFKRDFYRSFAGKELFVELGMYFAFDEIMKNLPAHIRILHFAELHGWENSLNMVRRKHLSFMTIGLQHTIMPLLLLNYFRDPRDFEHDNINGFPQPSYVGTTGEITRSLLIQNGWNPNKLFILGGFRFANILNLLNTKIVPRDHFKKNQIIVALSISDKENAEVIEMLNDSLKECDLNIKVFLKFHPCNNPRALIQKLQWSLDPRIEITNRSLEELVVESKGMIVKESSSIFEALARGVPIIVPQLYSMIDMCPLSGIYEGLHYVYNSQELLTKMKEICKNQDSLSNQESVNRFLNRYLYPFDKEKFLNMGLKTELNTAKIS